MMRMGTHGCWCMGTDEYWWIGIGTGGYIWEKMGTCGYIIMGTAGMKM